MCLEEDPLTRELIYLVYSFQSDMLHVLYLPLQDRGNY